MGRHSAPDEQSDQSDSSDPSDATTVVLQAVRVPRSARHHRTVEDDDDDDVELAELDEHPPSPDPASPQPASSQPAPRPEGATHADLRLLRESPALRARCAAAMVVPFILYTAAMFVIGTTAVYLVWVWIPTVVAGVTVGTFLDIAHRHEQSH
jgi:hypothetical protein